MQDFRTWMLLRIRMYVFSITVFLVTHWGLYHVQWIEEVCEPDGTVWFSAFSCHKT